VVETGEATKENVVDVPVRPDFGLGPETATTTVSETHETLGPLNSSTEYGEAPPDQVTVAMTVTFCPASITVGERTSVGVPNAVTMVTTVAEVVDALCGEGALSVTVAQ
jgi:hypothetical protein